MTLNIHLAHKSCSVEIRPPKFWCIHPEGKVMAAALIPGKLIDNKAGRACFKAQTRIGQKEEEMLQTLSKEFQISRSLLVRRLLVERLDQLNCEGI